MSGRFWKEPTDEHLPPPAVAGKDANPHQKWVAKRLREYTARTPKQEAWLNSFLRTHDNPQPSAMTPSAFEPPSPLSTGPYLGGTVKQPSLNGEDSTQSPPPRHTVPPSRSAAPSAVAVATATASSSNAAQVGIRKKKKTVEEEEETFDASAQDARNQSTSFFTGPVDAAPPSMPPPHTAYPPPPMASPYPPPAPSYSPYGASSAMGGDDLGGYGGEDEMGDDYEGANSMPPMGDQRSPLPPEILPRQAPVDSSLVQPFLQQMSTMTGQVVAMTDQVKQLHNQMIYLVQENSRISRESAIEARKDSDHVVTNSNAQVRMMTENMGSILQMLTAGHRANMEANQANLASTQNMIKVFQENSSTLITAAVGMVTSTDARRAQAEQAQIAAMAQLGKAMTREAVANAAALRANDVLESVGEDEPVMGEEAEGDISQLIGQGIQNAIGPTIDKVLSAALNKVGLNGPMMTSESVEKIVKATVDTAFAQARKNRQSTAQQPPPEEK